MVIKHPSTPLVQHLSGDIFLNLLIERDEPEDEFYTYYAIFAN